MFGSEGHVLFAGSFCHVDVE